MKKCEAAYLAALIDGEGHLGLSKPATKDRGWSARLTIKMTKAKDLLWGFSNLYGGNVYHYDMSDTNLKDQWAWQVQSKADLYPLLKGVVPHMRVKRQQAELLIQYLETVRSASENHRHNPLPDSVIAKRNRIYRSLRALNAVGRVS